MTGKRGSNLKRFEWSYLPEPNSGCWLWLKYLTPTGYGLFYYPPRNMVCAHIVAWELFKGERKGLHVLHTCNNPCCVNPEHLKLGTHQENMQDRTLANRTYRHIGVKNGRAKLTEADVILIRKDKRWQRFVAKQYGVGVTTIQKIRRREIWKHVS